MNRDQAAEDQAVPDLSRRLDFNSAWSAAKAARRALVWVERRRGGLWVAGADLLPAGGPVLGEGVYGAVERLCAALARHRAAVASYGYDRVVVAGLRTEGGAREVAHVLVAAAAGDAAPAERLVQLLAEPDGPAAATPQ